MQGQTAVFSVRPCSTMFVLLNVRTTSFSALGGVVKVWRLQFIPSLPSAKETTACAVTSVLVQICHTPRLSAPCSVFSLEVLREAVIVSICVVAS